MPLRNRVVFAVAFRIAAGVAWAFVAANSVQDAREGAGGNHGFQGNTVRATSRFTVTTPPAGRW
jgi:hypothetical protein